MDAGRKGGSAGPPVAPRRGGRLRPLPAGAVQLQDGFWGTRQQLNREAILSHCLAWMDRCGWIDNFRAAATGDLPGGHRGREFADADVYKLLEAFTWEVGRSGDAVLDQQVRDISPLIAGAQESDGYINTRWGHQGPAVRYIDLPWGHELYCYGHLLQAAVARLRTVGDDELVALARRAADHVTVEFADGAREGVPGHPEVEMALVELYRETGDERYLDQARRFIDRRGHGVLGDIEFGRSYFQDDVPIRDAEAFRGHAVRALYLACGAVDVAVETGDDELLEAIAAQWDRTVARRTYITGGMGSRHQDEAFGEDFELPPDRAYSETCAGVASVMLAWRLLLARGDARFADLAERTLYNIVATSPALDGRSFFYANTLQQRGIAAVPGRDEPSPRAQSALRAPWFAVACCPPNVARLLASLSGYVATTTDGGIQVHQYMPGSVEATVAGESNVRLHISTEYPWRGRVHVRVERAVSGRWALSLRVPAWCAEARVDDPDGVRVASPGYVTVERAWRPGDELVLDLTVAPRWVSADPRIDSVRGCVAAERGPVVYCLESIDQPDIPLDRVAVDPSSALAEDASDEPTLVTVRGQIRDIHDRGWPYAVGAAGTHPDRAARLTLVPYHRWGNRAAAAMRVWMPIGAGDPPP